MTMTHEELVSLGYDTEDGISYIGHVKLTTGEMACVQHEQQEHGQTVISVQVESVARAEEIVRLLDKVAQGMPAVKEFIAYTDFECGDTLLVDGKLTDDDAEVAVGDFESIEIGRTPEFNRQLAAAKKELGMEVEDEDAVR